MKKKKLNIPVYLYFATATLLIILFYPKEGGFSYSFMENRPWKYGLLTAPYDFPVYKPESMLQREQDSILKLFKPYFVIDDQVVERQLRELKDNYRQYLSEWDHSTYLYVEKSLKEVYFRGIVSAKDYEFLHQQGYDKFMAIENKVAIQRVTDKVFTSKTAYAYIFENCTDPVRKQALIEANIDHYLTENLEYDTGTSQKVKNELLQKVSPTTGLVQAGQKIIDRGEIVNKDTYQILYSLKIVSDTKSGVNYGTGWKVVGMIALIVFFMGCFFLYLYYFRPHICFNKKNILFLLSLACIFILLTEVCISQHLFNIYIIPYAIIPIVICTFLDSRTARMVHNICILICSLMVTLPGEFLVLQFMSGMVAIFTLKDLTNRYQLIKCSFFVLLTYIVIYTGLILGQVGTWSQIDWKMFIYFGINFIFLMFTYALIYIIERIFGFTSGVTLVELSDINNPILRELSEHCPGTFQHSMQVSVLGAAAASVIGANPLLVRTGALYHDIGKIKNPAFFIENQLGNHNPHDHLTYEQSARIIIGHVTEGVKMAEKNNFAPMIVDFIKTHHGNGIVKYFYHSYKNEFPDKPVDITQFTYPGPNPFSKETAILMMADAVEASSRSLNEYSEDSISQLVNKIINAQINDGLLKDAPITFRDVEKVKKVFIEKLLSMFHSRISYPDLIQEENETEKDLLI